MEGVFYRSDAHLVVPIREFKVLILIRDKCSAVAEMGDRLATIDMDEKVGAVPL